MSFKCKGKDLRKELCKQMYWDSVIQRVQEGDIDEITAEQLIEKAEFNIDTYNLTLSDDPIYWSIFGMNKGMLKMNRVKPNFINGQIK